MKEDFWLVAAVVLIVLALGFIAVNEANHDRENHCYRTGATREDFIFTGDVMIPTTEYQIQCDDGTFWR